MGYATAEGEETGEIVVLRQAAWEAIKADARELADEIAVLKVRLALVTAERDEYDEQLRVVHALSERKRRPNPFQG